MRNQIFVPNGCMKEKTLNSCFSGFLIIILIPVVINGFEKSTTRSRAWLMVSGATATSAVCISVDIAYFLQGFSQVPKSFFDTFVTLSFYGSLNLPYLSLPSLFSIVHTSFAIRSFELSQQSQSISEKNI